MEMDRQTIMVLCAAIIGLTLFGGYYLSSPAHERLSRPTYAEEDIRTKFQREEAKKPKDKKKPTRAPMTSKSTAEVSQDEEPTEEPSIDEDGSQEEPPIE